MGVIRHEYRISHAASMIGGSTKIPDSTISDCLLGYLPKHTKYLGYYLNPTPQFGLFVSYIMEFEHPLFEDDSVFEKDEIRVCWVDPLNINHLEQGYLLVGLRFYDKSANQLFNCLPPVPPSSMLPLPKRPVSPPTLPPLTFVPITIKIDSLDECICIGPPLKNCPTHGNP